jgi:hypothetical protein
MYARVRSIGAANRAIRCAENAQRKRSAAPQAFFVLREGTLPYSQSVRHKTRTARRCRCGHDHGAHVHYRPGTECALCDTCANFRPAAAFPPVLAWLTGSPDDPDPDDTEPGGPEPDDTEPGDPERGEPVSKARKPGGRGWLRRRRG